MLGMIVFLKMKLVIQSYVHFLMCNLKKMNLLFIKKELLN